MAALNDLVGKDNDYYTPEDILSPVRAYLGGPIPLDPATAPHNPTKAETFYTEEDDGLEQSWGVPFFVNPPYSLATKLPPSASEEEVKAEKKRLRAEVAEKGERLFGFRSSSLFALWTAKIREAVTMTARGVMGFALLPCGARFSTRYWQRDIFQGRLTAALYPLGRVPFLRIDGTPAKQNPWDSQLLLFNGDPYRFRDCFEHLGSVLKVEVMNTR